MELAGDLTSSQRQWLRTIVEKNTGWPETKDQPFKYVYPSVEGILTEEIYRIDIELRNGIKERLKTLAQQYAADKDYQKWATEVWPKIFPDALPDNSKKE